MTKAELLKNWQKEANMYMPTPFSVELYGTLLGILSNVITTELLGGGEVPFPALGKLKTKRTKARAGRNPRTGAPITIPTGTRVTFMPNKELKDALKGE